MFSKNIRTIYLYVVSFISLMTLIYGTVFLVEKITNYIYPVAYIYDYSTEPNYQIKNDYTTTSDTVSTTNSVANQEKRAKRQNLKDIFTAAAVVVVSAGVYSFHWTMVEKERKRV